MKIDNENMEDIKQNNEKGELPYALVLISPPKIMLKVNPQGNNTERKTILRGDVVRKNSAVITGLTACNRGP